METQGVNQWIVTGAHSLDKLYSWVWSLGEAEEHEKPLKGFEQRN